MPEVKLQGFVGINSDDEYQMVPQPDTITGENIVIQSTSEGQNASVKPRLGDTYKFQIPDFTQTNKKYRVRGLVQYEYYSNTGVPAGYNSIYLKIASVGGDRLFAEATGSAVYDSAGNLISSPLQEVRTALIDVLNSNSFLDPGNPNSILFDIDLGSDEQGDYLDITPPFGVVLTSNTIPPVTTAIENPNAYFDDFVVSSIPENDNDISIACISDSIRPSMAGPAKVIGSVDYLGDTFVFSCVEDRPSISFSAVEVIVQDGYLEPKPFFQISPYAIVTCINHGLQNGELIDIYIPNQSFVSGTYDITVIDSNRFHLNGYPYTGFVGRVVDTLPVIYSDDILITKNTRSVGEIGVFYKNFNDEEVYVRLLRSSELNFRTYHQIDVEAESTLDKIALYFTDNLNKPRVFYYKGEYVEDGAIEVINSLNTYEYGSIDEQLRLFISSNSLKVTFIEQLQTGGNLYAGNKRYVARGLSSDFTEGLWSNASGLVPVYASNGEILPRKIKGDSTGYQTEKVNVIEVSGIDFSIYSFIEIGVIEYLDSGFEAFILDRLPINGNSVIRYEHNGRETEKQSISSQSFNLDNKSIKKALNLSILDNRLLLSNIEYRSEKDLSSILDTVKYSLKHRAIPKQGREILNVPAITYSSIGDSYRNGLSLAEYQDPYNVNNFVGYVTNETYLFAARFIFKDGFESKPIPFTKVKFDTEPASDDERRLSGLPSYSTISGESLSPSLGSLNEGDILVNYIEFSGFNFSAIIDGAPAYLLIDRIEIMRSEVTNPTVLCSGLGVLGLKTGFENIGGTVYDVVEPNSFITCNGQGYLYTDIIGGNYLKYNNIISLYCPDILFGNDGTYPSIDQDTQLIVFGGHAMLPILNYIDDYYNTPNGVGGYFYFGGNSGFQNEGFNQLNTVGIVEAHNIPDGGQQLFNESGVYSFLFKNKLINPDYKWVRNLTLFLDENIPVYNPPNVGGFPQPKDRGLRYVQLYKPNPNQYSDVDLVTYVNTGASLTSDDDTVSVFGGDCFLQKTTMKLMVNQGTFSSVNPPVCVDFYSHNRVNSQLRGSETVDQFYPFNFDNVVQWLLHPFFDDLSYSKSYNPALLGQTKLSYLSILPDDTIQPTTIAYSSVKIRGSVQDSYRNFAYSDFTSLDTTYGPINFMKAMNGELYTIQDRRIQRQFFNTRGVLSTSDGATALIGDGAAFYRDGVTISTMGSKHKWSVITGRSFGGNDVWYWYDDVNRSIVRFGADGIVPISTRAKIRTRLRSITDLARFNYTPADCFGIHGVWNEKLSEVVWVFRLARNYKGIWQQGVFVKEGDVYSIRNQFYDESFEEIPVLYMCQTNLGTSILSPDADTATWSRIEYGDEGYMKFFSVVFSEAQNRFISIDDIYPKIFMKNEDDVYYPRPKEPVSAILKKDSGAPLSFYNYLDGESKTVFGVVESVFNIDPNIQKKAVALRVNSELVPSQVEVRSENGQTFMIDSDFQGRLDQWDSPVLNNTPNIAGRKNDTGGIFGKYIRVKFIFAPLQLQRLINMVLKFKPVSRNYNT